ncbi:hypothetical protein LTR57_001359 [Friedmanniomyces endolithicus]|nr:hypothetical protein LTR57_001359 [Friedmanniomyces endolithicus]
MDSQMLPAKCPDCNQSLDNIPTQTSRYPDRQPGAPLDTESDTIDNSQFQFEVTALGAFLSIFQGGLLAPTRTTYDSIDQLLNAPTKAVRDELTKRWCDHKLEELNFVGVVGALLTGWYVPDLRAYLMASLMEFSYCPRDTMVTGSWLLMKIQRKASVSARTDHQLVGMLTTR